MAYNSGFFDAMKIGDDPSGEALYDRRYSAADFAHYFSLLVGNGVFYLPENGLKVEAEIAPSMSIVVNPGNGWIDGYYVSVPEGSPEHISISVADASKPRIDSIVMGLSLLNRQIKIYYKKGVASSSPSPVDLVRDASTQEYELAQLFIQPGSSSVTNENITDKRPDSSRCGFVKSLVEKETGYLEDFVKKSEKGKPNGLATLNSIGKVPSSQLPSLDYIPTNKRGAANGVASLDDSGKVPSGQLPSMNYIPTSQKGAANGVATLVGGKLPESQVTKTVTEHRATVFVDSTFCYMKSIDGQDVKYARFGPILAVYGTADIFYTSFGAGTIWADIQKVMLCFPINLNGEKFKNYGVCAVQADLTVHKNSGYGYSETPLIVSTEFINGSLRLNVGIERDSGFDSNTLFRFRFFMIGLAE